MARHVVTSGTACGILRVWASSEAGTGTLPPPAPGDGPLRWCVAGTAELAVERLLGCGVRLPIVVEHALYLGEHCWVAWSIEEAGR